MKKLIFGFVALSLTLVSAQGSFADTQSTTLDEQEFQCAAVAGGILAEGGLALGASFITIVAGGALAYQYKNDAKKAYLIEKNTLENDCTPAVLKQAESQGSQLESKVSEAIQLINDKLNSLGN